MCGIIGYVGEREAKPLLLSGLRRLEYRGYDSAGIALREVDGLDYVRAVGNLENLVEVAGPNGSVTCHGVGHTRWATHGAVTEQNAHPLVGCDATKLAIVLNGIVENYRELREQLREAGHTFSSETDAEVVVHLLKQEDAGAGAVLQRRRGNRPSGGRAARLGRRPRREGRLRDLHAEGDLRPAGSGAGDDRRPGSRPRADARGARPHRARGAQPAANRDR